MHFLATLGLIFAATTALAAPAGELEARQSLSSSRNDVKSRKCAPVTVIFARGTTELGNVGSIAGPPFFTAIDKAVGSIAVQGVDYPADVVGFLAGGSSDGAKNMAQYAQTAITNCPDTKLVMSGYSQGAQVARKAVNQLGAAQSSIGAIVLFGDPNNGDSWGALQAKTKTFCNVGDLICAGTSVILPAHLTYGSDATAAANFVKQMVGA
ncbi:cutinase [Tricharina praecox]|uniref:cutinase n=1 Tax=Tricharina praecox TaxID=43433 RepID=UPI0022209247|nr:cutinase [Tricharina praecox]KAI5858158.1 cutinase [Tricharina praecox]